MILKEKKVLTFDCYGTLIDWETGIISYLGGVLRNHLVNISDNEVLQLFGKTEHIVQDNHPDMIYLEVLREVLKSVAKKYGFSPSNEELNSFCYSIQQWKPFLDTTSALKILSTYFKLVIISNIDNQSISHSVQHMKVDFYKIFTAEMIGAYKPDHKVFRYALDQLEATDQFKMADVLHVAESIYHDHVPAREIGLDSIWINRRHSKSGYGATPQVNPDQIPAQSFPTLMDFAHWVQKTY